MHPLGFSPNPVPLDNTVPGQGVFNSDLAFWGDTAVQGTFAGFRLVNIEEPGTRWRLSTGRSAPARRALPKPGRCHHLGRPRHPLLELADARTPGRRSDIPFTDPARYTHRARSAVTGPCSGNRQPRRCPSEARRAFTSSTSATRSTRTSSPSSTRRAVAHGDAGPDLENDRLLVYSNSSAGNTTFGGPARRPEPLILPRHRHHRGAPGRPGGGLVPALRAVRRPGRGHRHHPCHDTAVILGDANSSRAPVPAALANGGSVFTMDPALGGSRKTRSGCTTR